MALANSSIERLEVLIYLSAWLHLNAYEFSELLFEGALSHPIGHTDI